MEMWLAAWDVYGGYMNDVPFLLMHATCSRKIENFFYLILTISSFLLFLIYVSQFFLSQLKISSSFGLLIFIWVDNSNDLGHQFSHTCPTVDVLIVAKFINYSFKIQSQAIVALSSYSLYGWMTSGKNMG